MDDDDPADFYTGIVVDVYGPLKGSVPDPQTYAGFISWWGNLRSNSGAETAIPC